MNDSDQSCFLPKCPTIAFRLIDVKKKEVSSLQKSSFPIPIINDYIQISRVPASVQCFCRVVDLFIEAVLHLVLILQDEAVV